MFEALLNHLKFAEGTGKVYEVISVGGKTLFTQYEKLLAACKVPYFIIADLDYVKDIGDHEVKLLFALSPQGVKQKVIDDPSSSDAATLIARMEDAIRDGDMADLTSLWNYIKSRQTKLRTDLTETETCVLEKFLKVQRNQRRFILSKGALEAYLPIGFRDKNLEKVIRLAAEADLWSRLPSDGKTELKEILTRIAF